jgi:hypothetical protein
VDLTQIVVLNECFHVVPHKIGREYRCTGCAKIVKIPK